MTILSLNSTRIILITLLTILVLPFIINCFFAYPQTDDFCFAHMSYNLGFLKAQYNMFFEWTGRFTSTALLSINPLVYHSLTGYNFTLAFIMLSLFASIFLLTNALIKKAVSWQGKLIFSLTIFFAYLDRIDDIRSAFYWMAGAITYQIALTLLIAYILLLLKIDEDRNNGKLPHKYLAVFIGFFLCGTNEIILVITLIITAYFVVNNYWMNKQLNIFQAAIVTVVTVGGGLGVLAPGNYVRLLKSYERQSIVVTAWYAFKKTLVTVGYWMTSPMTVILMAMILFAAIRMPDIKPIFVRFRIISSLSILFLFTFLCFFIPYWCTGAPPDNRVINMTYLIFLVGWLISCAIIAVRYGEPLVDALKIIPVKTGVVFVVVFMFFLFSIGSSNFSLVAKDLLSGDSFKYNIEMRQRALQITTSDQENCSLKKNSVMPDSLYFYFIGPDKNYWVNSCYAKYFGKKSVIVTK